MNDPIQHEPEMKELEHENPFASAEAAKTTEEASMSIKDPDRTLSMIVLLLACLGLAALAHVFI